VGRQMIGEDQLQPRRHGACEDGVRVTPGVVKRSRWRLGWEPRAIDDLYITGGLEPTCPVVQQSRDRNNGEATVVISEATRCGHDG
jgi:hypothetical protein